MVVERVKVCDRCCEGVFSEIGPEVSMRPLRT